MKLARYALHHDKLIVFVVVVLAALGVRAYLTTPQSIFPNMSFSRIDVVADVGVLPPQQVRVAVTQPLEQAFQALPSVEKVRTTSSQGSAELVVSFATSTNPQVDLQYVDQAISQVRTSIPAAGKIVAVAITPQSEPVLSYALTSRDVSQAVLREIALYGIAPRIYGAKGLGRLLVAGGPTTEFHVRLDATALAAAGIGPADVSRAITDANSVVAVGLAERYYQQSALLVDASLHDVASLEALPIPTHGGATVPLRSLARVTLGVSPVTDQASFDGRRAVMINAYGLPGADAVAMARDVRARLAAASAHLPADVRVQPYWDQTTLVVDSQSALRDAILLGALLAVLVIYAFLRSIRLTLVAAAIIPIAMAIAVFVLQQGGQTLNLMSVGGLAVAVGLIIDDAIVVIENISRNLAVARGESIDDTIARSMGQITGAMIASTTTTVVVFVPLALLSGVTGYFFRALALTLAGSLVVSILLALFLAPIIARYVARPEPERHDILTVLLERYDGVLRWALGHRAIVYGCAAGILALTVVLLVRLPSDFLPKMDEGQFEISYQLAPGTTLAASDGAATAMERIVLADPAVSSVGRLTGIDSNGYSPTQPSQGLLRVRLVAADKRPGYDAVSARLRDRLQAAVPAANFDFHQILEDMINDLSGAPAPIEVALHGNDPAALRGLARTVADRLANVRGVVDVNPGIVYDSPSIRIAPRGQRLAALGLAPTDLADALSSSAQGTIATTIPGTRAQVPVRVELAHPALESGAFGSAAAYAHGAPIALRSLAELGTPELTSEISTVNGSPVVRVTANFAEASLSSVTTGIEHVLAGVAFPPGTYADIGGQSRSQQQSFGEFLSVMAVAIVLVFAAMLATFRSFRLPLVILTAIPLALIGVALGLFVTNTPFNVSSFMGLLLLVGLVVKNGILLIDVANKRRSEGASIEDALVAAGKTRLRPIVMTTLAAIGGLLPLAFGIGQGAEMEKPLAIAVIGGLSTATAFTLIAIPVLYASFIGGDERSAPRLAEALA